MVWGGGGVVLMQPENSQEREVCPSICNLDELLNMFTYNQVRFSWGLKGGSKGHLLVSYMVQLQPT